ncbi:MAG: hypothetical protein B655_1732 [Methanobacterium sp. Maddingley MBC34]|nr:MAG: hypothetical protein B655_1732 [Methanobacterium sp. Maddingley MBC34]
MNKILPLMAVTLMVVLVSGCVTDNKSNQTNNFSQNGVFFQYPASWGVASVSSPNGVAAVGDPNTVVNGNPTTSVVIQKPNATASSVLKTAYDENYAQFFNNTGKTKVSEAQLTLNGVQVYENVYTSSEEGLAKKYRAVWMQKGSTIYVILCSARVENYDAQQSNFDLVVNSFQVS